MQGVNELDKPHACVGHQSLPHVPSPPLCAHVKLLLSTELQTQKNLSSLLHEKKENEVAEWFNYGAYPGYKECYVWTSV